MTNVPCCTSLTIGLVRPRHFAGLTDEMPQGLQQCH